MKVHFRNPRNESKNVLNNYESKINKAQKDSINILNQAKKESEKIIIENTEKFYDFIENRKKTTEQKIIQMKEDALKDIKNISVKITIEAIEKLIKNTNPDYVFHLANWQFNPMIHTIFHFNFKH